MEDCGKGLIDIVLCKSISRFARNTVDLLSAIRRLKELGVEIRFEKENVSNMTADGELMMTLLAVFSQSENESISSNCKWGIRKRFQDGTIGAANKHILGYRYDDRLEKHVIIPEEAVIVKEMFSLYLKGLSLQTICDRLNDEGHRTTNGCLFRESSLNILLHNEIYAGNLLRQKTFTENTLTKVKVKNKGQLPQYCYEDAHEAIIDRETYALVQKEMARRTSMLNPTYCFSGKLRCGCCGMPFTRRKSRVKGKEYISWICRGKKEVGKTCGSVNFNESELMSICAGVLALPAFDEEAFLSSVWEMTVLPSGGIRFTMADGETKEWKNLRLSVYRHTATCTDAFQGKIRCSLCGSVYHRVNSAGKWVYWYCMGRKNRKKCKNHTYTDYHLRIITAHMMGTDCFDEGAFLDRVDHIEAVENGLSYYFKDGSVKTWRDYRTGGASLGKED